MPTPNLDGINNQNQKPTPPASPPTEDQEIKKGKILLSWQAPEYEQQRKPRNWYIASAILALILIGVSIYLRNYLLLIIVVMLGVVVILMDRKNPLIFKIEINENGIGIAEKFYPYRDLENFWIVYDPPLKTLNFRMKRNFFPFLAIQLEDQNPNELREILTKYLPENHEVTEESPKERLTRILKI